MGLTLIGVLFPSRRVLLFILKTTSPLDTLLVLSVT